MNPWEMGETLGKGASGTVFRAFNIDTGESAAIKVMALTDVDYSSSQNEIQLLRNLNHPNIVRYYGYIESKKTISIIMEYCEGGSLRTMIDRFGNLTESLAIQYIRQILKGLNYLHDQGIVHRDVKAANILTTKDSIAKLADFGISGRIDKFSAGIFEGSTYWMAPEVIELVGASYSSDIWSLACTAIEMVSGSPPYFDLEPLAALFRIVSDEFVPYPGSISNEFVDFLNICFQRNPNLRTNTKSLLLHEWVQMFARKADQDMYLKSHETLSVNLSQYKEPEIDDFEQDLLIEGELSFKQISIEDENLLAEDLIDDPLYSRSWSGRFLRLLNHEKSCSAKETYMMLEDFVSRSQLVSAVWLTKLSDNDNFIKRKLVESVIGILDFENALDLQLLIAVRTVLQPLHEVSEESSTILAHIMTLLPFSAFELYQESIERHFDGQNISSLIMVNSLLHILQSKAGNELNCLRKLIAMSNIPAIILKLMSSTRDISCQFADYALNLLLSVSKGSREIVFELGKESNLRGKIAINLVFFDLLYISGDDMKIPILKIIKNIAHVRECSTFFDECNAMEILCAEFWRIGGRTDLESCSLVICVLSTLARMDAVRLNSLVSYGTLPEILHFASSKSPLKQYAIKILCEVASFASIPSEMKKATVHALTGLLFEVCYRSQALKSIFILLSKDHSILKILDFKEFFENFTASEILDSDFLYYLFKIITSDRNLASGFLKTGILNFLDHVSENPKKQYDLVRIYREIQHFEIKIGRVSAGSTGY